MKQYVKKCLAAVLSAAMVFTMLPSSVVNAEGGAAANVSGVTASSSTTVLGSARRAAFGSVLSKNVDADYKETKDIAVTIEATNENLLAAYTFDVTGDDGTLFEDESGHGNDARLKGTGATMSNGILTLPGGSHANTYDETSPAYVEIPGSVFAGQDTLTITTWLKNRTGSGDYAAMYFGTKSKNVDSSLTNNMPLHYWLLNPAKGDCFKSVWTDGDNAEAPYSTETATSGIRTSSDWAMYTTVITADEIVGYYNGVEASRASKTKKTTDLGNDLVAYIGRSAYADKFYQGGVYGVEIYKEALTQQAIMSKYYESGPAEMDRTGLFSNVGDGLFAEMLNGNSKDNITTNLSFPEEKNLVKLTWETDTAVFDAAGKIVYNGDEDKQTTIKVTGKYGEEKVFEDTYTVKVVGGNNAVAADADALDIPNKDNIKGNIMLPSVGKNGSAITWTSSNKKVISDEEKENAGYDSTPAGVVTRQAADTDVKLTAKISKGTKSQTKVFDVTVKAKSDKPDPMNAYLYVYFLGENPGEEEIYLAASEDGLNWSELNGGKSVLESTLGTKGLRDPFIIRSAEGDKFYLIATDLRICTDWDWTAAQRFGSQSIMVWESEDLVHWSDQRMVTVSANIKAGCTWAPEAFYDEKTGEYVVFWASMVATDNYAKQRVYYSKTRDFYSFTNPKVWIDESHSTIDSTVVKDGDTYYRFSKNESKTFVYLEKSSSLLGEWTTVNANIAGGVEGPSCFAFNEDDVAGAGAKWCLLLDDFGVAGGGYYPMTTNDLATGEFTKLTTAKLPTNPRHGTVMNITAAEYEAVTYASETLAKEKVEASVDGITVEPAETTLKVGDAADITINYPADFTENLQASGLTQTVTYESDNASAAEAADGKISAKGVGTATITTKIALSSGMEKRLTTAVTVEKAPEVLVESVLLNKKTLSLSVGVSSTLKATVTPADAANGKVSWSSSNEKIATVDQKGNVEGIKAGTATITATAGDMSASCTVTVKAVKAKKVALNAKKLTLGVKETFALKATITPANTTNKKATYTSNKPKIVAVNKTSGKITAKKKGTAKITVTAADGSKKKAICTVTVKPAPKKIQKLNKTKVTLKKGKTFQIKVTLPKGTASHKIIYTSKNKKIATVSATGKIKAVKKGTTTITVKTFNNKKKTIKVTVKK